MEKKISGFLHYRTDLGDGTRTGVVFSDCIGACHEYCGGQHFLEEHVFSEDSLEKNRYSESELISYLQEEKILCYTKKLGITFLGKDPLSDPFYCKDVAKGIKEAGMSLQIFTCGMCSLSAFDLLDGYVDLYVLRLFSLDKNLSNEHLFPSVEHTLDIIEFFEKRGYSYRLLIPVIRGVNDQSSLEFAEFLSKLSLLKSVILDFSKSDFSMNEIKEYKMPFFERKVTLY